MGAGQRGGVGIGGQEVNLVLPILHPCHIVGQGHGLGTALPCGRGKTQELGDTLAVSEVFADPFFQHLAEFPPEGGVFVGLVSSEVVEHAQDFFHATGTDGINVF